MKRFDLIRLITRRQTELSLNDVMMGVRTVTRIIREALQENRRVELRGFGVFKTHYRAPYTGRNPRTGETVKVQSRYLPRFKPAGKLRTRVNDHHDAGD